jgi:hypothetical protein
MAYYPKSQIKTGLTTQGKEYRVISTQEEYKGEYYMLSNGKVFAGKNPNFKPKIQLEKISQLIDNTDISDPKTKENLKEPLPLPKMSVDFQPLYKPDLEVSLNRSIPKYRSTLPTEDDKQKGYYTRYYCKKNNELRYFEIDKDTFSKLNSKSNDIAWDLYTPLSLKWRIKGIQSSVYSQNLSEVSLKSSKFEWMGFMEYFRSNFSQYYVGQSSSPSSPPPLQNTSLPNQSTSTGNISGGSSGGSSGGGY